MNGEPQYKDPWLVTYDEDREEAGALHPLHLHPRGKETPATYPFRV